MTMPTTPVSWIGNRVTMRPMEGTELTAIEWRRPLHGTTRGARILGADELAQVTAAVAEAAAGDRPAPRLDGYAGRPLHLEVFLEELLDH